MPLVHCLSRTYIGEYIGSPEAVDRLFRIADQKERTVVCREDSGENVVLYRIGILKLIDQRTLILLPNSRGNPGSLPGRQRLFDSKQQIVEELDILSFFPDG